MNIVNNLEIKKYKIDTNFARQKLRSHPSSTSYKVSTELSIHYQPKRTAIIRKKNNPGLASSGKRVLRSRAKRISNIRWPNFNYHLRDNSLMFVSNVFLFPKSLKFSSVLLFHSGAACLLPTTNRHFLFILFGKYRPSPEEEGISRGFLSINTWWNFPKFVKRLVDLPKNKPVCLLEHYYSRGVKYVRAAGSQAKLIKLDSRSGASIVRLPSKATKIFEAYSFGAEGTVEFVSKRLILENKAGKCRAFGHKPVVRGVAMNPVDHPHGGRAKSIKHQKNPWGKTAKKSRAPRT